MENKASGDVPDLPTDSPIPNPNLPWPEPMWCERHQTDHKSHAVQNWCFSLSQ